jgi:hypothetical protein
LFEAQFPINFQSVWLDAKAGPECQGQIVLASPLTCHINSNRTPQHNQHRRSASSESKDSEQMKSSKGIRSACLSGSGANFILK